MWSMYCVVSEPNLACFIWCVAQMIQKERVVFEELPF